MRSFVLVLMLVLLPLRGWMGDAMATQMATGTATGTILGAINTVASPAHEQRANGSFEHKEVGAGPVAQAMTDCAEHMSKALAANQATSDSFNSSNSSDATDQNGHADHCQTCQACHSVAMSSSALVVSSSFSAPSQPQALSTPFTSAIAALSQKPPIS